MNNRTICFFVICTILSLSGPPSALAENPTVVIRGSHALYLTLKPHVEMIEKNIQVKVDFSKAGGCNDGAKQLSEGKGAGAICCPFDEEERALLGGAIVHPLALEPIMIIVNKKNPLEELSAEQVRAILSGRIKNWRAVGGPDQKIAVVMRPHCASRPGHWKTILPFDQWKPNLLVDKFLKMITTVAKLPGAIGHLGTVLYDPTKMRVIRVDGVDPLDSNVFAKHYPFYRPISLLTKPKPSAAEKSLIAFLGSDAAKPVFTSKHLLPGNRLTP